ncbi:MAG: leucine-rich repeat protein, partial [Clostridia bacterium]
GVRTITINYQNATLNVSIRINPAGDTTYYELTFNAGEGFFPQDITGSGGGKTHVVTTAELTEAGRTKLMQLPPEPRRPGYEFKGWYKTPNFTDTPIGAPYYIGYTHTLYARWADAQKVTVTFGTNHIPSISTQTVEYNSDIVAPQAPQRTGEVFIGWKYKDKHYLPGTTIQGITDGGFILGEYRNIEIKITFKSVAWDEDITYTVAYSSNFTEEPRVPEIPGKTGRWMVQVSPTRKEVPVYTNMIADLVVEAEYTAITYNVNFYRFPSNPWDISDRTKAVLYITRGQEYNTRIDPIPSFEAVDLKLDGGIGEWVYLSPSGDYTNANSILQSGITQDYDIYARYTPIYYKVTFDFSGTKYSTEYRHGTVLEPDDFPANLPIPDAKEYTLRWWSRGASDFTNPQYQISFPLAPLTAPRELYANITRNPRAVDFRIFPEDNEGNPIDASVNLNLGRKLLKMETNLNTETPVFQHDKYEYTGAWTYIDGSTVTDFNSLQTFKEYDPDPTKDRALYVRLKIREYEVTYYNVEIKPGDASSPYKYEFVEVYSEFVRFGVTIKDPPSGEQEVAPYTGALVVPSYPGSTDGVFKFEGWYTAENYGGAKINFATGYQINSDTKNKTNIYAKWLDEEKGTEGLRFSPIYNPDEEGDVVGYYLSDFEPGTSHYDEIYIPRYYNEKPVTGISETAFSNALGIPIITVKISNYINDIDEGTFMRLTGLQGFTFADNQEQNPSYYYKEHSGVLYGLDEEGIAQLFCYPTGLENTSFEVPRSVSVGNNEMSITRIAEAAFAMNDFIKVVTFAANSEVQEIGRDAFMSCQHLESIDIPDSLLMIGEGAFNSSARLENVNYTSNANLLFVGSGAFHDTKWLGQEQSIISLAGVLIRYTGTDTELIIDDEIIAIADDAFYSPVETLPLISITFTENSGLRYIGHRAFAPCVSLKEIYLLGEYPLDFEYDTFEGVMDATFFVPEEHIEYYFYNLNLDEGEEDKVQPWG